MWLEALSRWWLRTHGRVALRGFRGLVGEEGAGLGRLQASTPQLWWAAELPGARRSTVLARPPAVRGLRICKYLGQAPSQVAPLLVRGHAQHPALVAGRFLDAELRNWRRRGVRSHEQEGTWLQ